MSFQLGRKVIIVNDADQAQLLYYAKLASGITRLVETDDDFQTTTAFDDLVASPDTQSGAEGAGYLPATVASDETIAQADLLRILGFGDFVGSEIASVVGSKGIPGAYQVGTITLTIPTVEVGDEIIVDIAFQADDLRGEFASYFSDYKKIRSFVIPVKAGDDATAIALRLKNQISEITDSGWKAFVTATAALGVVTLTSTDVEVTFSATFRGSAIDSGNATGAYATTTTGFPGRNTYEQLKGLRLETVNTPYAETFKTMQVPIRGAKYSSYTIKKTVTRPDLAGQGGGINSTPSGSFEFQIFVNESLTAYISNLTKWLNANVANRTMYTETTAAGALDGTDASTSATAVDSSEPFTTPLV